MSDEHEVKSLRISSWTPGSDAPPSDQRPTVALPPLADGQSHWTVDPGPLPEPTPRAFTWDDARDIATLVRDSLLMLVKGLERKFGLGKK
jgi:hypothetical protein